jgi:peptide/nickel transport system permease protein
MVPVITIIAIQLGHLLGGAVITESVFAWPGVGRLLLLSINARDYLVIQAVIVTLAVVFVFANLAADILYALLDPRIKLGRSQGS